MEIVLSLMLGLGLAAAVGLRLFIPFLLVSLAANTGHLELSASFAWIGSVPALVMFAVATLVEITAYYIPWLDNLLDTMAAPAAVLCGSVLMASTLFELDPFIKWPVAIIAGGGTAGLIHSGTAGLRLGSSAMTGGLGNPALASIESTGSVAMSLLALLFPLLAGILVIALLVWILKRTRRLGARRSRPSPR